MSCGSDESATSEWLGQAIPPGTPPSVVDPDARQPIGWVLAAYEDPLQAGNVISYVGATLRQDRVTACSPLPADDLTFYYDREAAVRYVIAHSYQNLIYLPDDGSTTNRLTPRLWYTPTPGPAGTPSATPQIPSNLDVSTIPYFHFDYLSNSTPPGIVHIPPTPTPSPTGGAVYPTTAYVPRTGSAAFLSQGIWMGGMPMTWNYAPAATPLPGTVQPTLPTDCVSAATPANNGWRHCTTSIGGTGNTIWMNHLWLIPYYTGVYLPNIDPNTGETFSTSPNLAGPSGVESAPMVLLGPSNHGNGVPAPTFQYPEGSRVIPIAAATIISRELDGSEPGSLRLLDPDNGAIVDFTNFTKYVEDRLTMLDPSSSIRTGLVQGGDYMWINQENNLTHGYMVVGWGATRNCGELLRNENAMNRVTLNNGLYLTYAEAVAQLGTNDVVPYVADFSFRLQHPFPRPFYCSRVFPPINNNYYSIPVDGAGQLRNDLGAHWSLFDQRHDWYFFALPDEVTIDSNLLFNDEQWAWMDADGRIPTPIP